MELGPAPPPASKSKRATLVIVLAAGAIVLVVAAAAGFLIWRGGAGPMRASSADPGSLGFDAEPFDPNAVPPAAGDTGFESEAAPSEAITAPPPPAVPAAASQPAATLTTDAARDVVGRMLQAMHDGNADAAIALATARMQKTVNNDRTWFGPGPEVLISFEVRDAVSEGEGMKVYCIEQWNSGPEKTAYIVVLKDGTPMVDLIEWSDL